MTKTDIRRLRSPYPTNCTEEEDANELSSKYTKASCKESCVVSRMIDQCGDEIDRFKKYYKRSYNASFDSKYSSVEECLQDMVLQAQIRNFVDCACNLQCHEIKYKVRDVGLPRIKGTGDWRFYIYYEDREVKTVSQVPAYPLDDLLGALGGILGLFIGMSILSGVQIVIFCIVFVMNLFS